MWYDLCLNIFLLGWSLHYGNFCKHKRDYNIKCLVWYLAYGKWSSKSQNVFIDDNYDIDDGDDSVGEGDGIDDGDCI